MKKTFSRLILVFAVFSLLCLTSCQKELNFPATQITLVNPGFEIQLTGWKVETEYTGWYGFSSDTMARITGGHGLNFYASQPEHFPGAPQETPWNGKIYQTVTGLRDGKYTFTAFADAVGTGMYLWANGGPHTSEVKVAIKSDVNELNTLDFTVKGGTAQIGFVCIDADGNPLVLAPYFHADDVELWSR